MDCHVTLPYLCFRNNAEKQKKQTIIENQQVMKQYKQKDAFYIANTKALEACVAEGRNDIVVRIKEADKKYIVVMPLGVIDGKKKIAILDTVYYK